MSAVDAWIRSKSVDRNGHRRKPPTLDRLLRDTDGLKALLADSIIVERPYEFTTRERETVDSLSHLAGVPVGIGCVQPERHRTRHGTHPMTGRVICWTCHPPAMAQDQLPPTTHEAPTEIELDALGRQLSVIAGDEPETSFLEIRTLKPIGPRVWIGAQDRDRARKVSEVVRGLRENHDVYIGAAPRVRKSGTAEDVERVWALWSDCDSRESAAALLTFTPAPSFVLDSGRPFHLHAYWALRAPAPPTIAQIVAQRLARELGTDNVSDPPRVLRPIGSRNGKSGQITRCIRATSERFDLADIVRALPADTRAAAPPSSRGRTVSSNGIAGLVDAVRRAQNGNRNNILHWAACRAREHIDRGEIQFEAAYDALRQAALDANMHPASDGVDATLRSGLGPPR